MHQLLSNANITCSIEKRWKEITDLSLKSTDTELLSGLHWHKVSFLENTMMESSLMILESKSGIQCGVTGLKILTLVVKRKKSY